MFASSLANAAHNRIKNIEASQQPPPLRMYHQPEKCRSDAVRVNRNFALLSQHGPFMRQGNVEY